MSVIPTATRSRLWLAEESGGMTITVYGIPNCDTVKKARVWLRAHGIAYTFHDYKKAGIDAAKLTAWCGSQGWETLINRAGTTFKKLPEAEKIDLTQAAACALMAAQPSMIKRPVVEYSGGVLVGFKPEIWTVALVKAI
jgi:arsenate reductase (glutaredoxin)